jgi:large subunit ribosomal protein L31
MKPDIHPHYARVKVTCSCGNSFETGTASEREQFLLEVCAKCHPFYTGEQKTVGAAGRVDRFRQKYGTIKTKSKEEKK